MVEDAEYKKFEHSSFGECIGPAENGDHSAQARLSLLYLNGDGVRLDVGAGSQWLEKSAEDFQAVNYHFKAGRERGEAGSIYGLFLMWTGGHGVPQNNKIAGKYLKQAANMGYAQAECVMGIYEGSDFHEIYGLSSSTRKAEKWLLKAQKRGHAQSNYHLYVLYSRRLKRPNVKKAFPFLELAVLEGGQASLEFMGQAYENGSGTEQDLIKATKFYYLSAIQNDGDTPHGFLTTVAKKLSKADLSNAIAQAEDWVLTNGGNARYFERKTQDPFQTA